MLSLDRRVLAVNAAVGLPGPDLEIGEEVMGTRSAGLVRVATTNTRLLGITTQIASWRELRRRVSERASLPERIYVGERLALAILNERIAALAPRSTGWNEVALTPRASIAHTAVGSNVAGSPRSCVPSASRPAAVLSA